MLYIYITKTLIKHLTYIIKDTNKDTYIIPISLLPTSLQSKVQPGYMFNIRYIHIYICIYIYIYISNTKHITWLNF